MSDHLPAPITGPSVWTSAELAADDGWIYPLSAADIGELEAAVDAVRDAGKVLYAFGRDDFPLPTLGPTMVAITDQLENGRGCALIRGLDATQYDEETLKMIYWGLGVHLG
ncbi:MAG: taurine catabolism dioxygenase TauD, partial [Rhodospirillales bacterium]